MRALVFLLFSLQAVLGYKYLVYSPLFGHSHCNYLGTIADTLTQRGHDVTVLQPVMDRGLMDKTGVKLTKKKILVEGDPEYSEYADSYIKSMFHDYWTMTTDAESMKEMGRNFTVLFSAACDMLCKNKTLLEELRNEKFDVGIAEPFYICGFGLFEQLNISKVIAATSGTHFDAVSYYLGEPLAPSYVPSMASDSGIPQGMFERAWGAFMTWTGLHFFAGIYEGESEVLRKHFGDSYSGQEEVLARSSVHFTQSNPFLDYPRPKIHKTVELGGITANIEKTAPLPEKFDKILSEREHTVLLSFGSVAKSKDMPEKYRKSILDVMASLPNVTFIWKYEVDTKIADHLPNVHFSKWQPQTALLADPRLSVFITHGGLGSTIEVAHSGKPAIMIPIFAEQPRNSAMLFQHGGAVMLRRSDLEDREKLRNTILTMINDKSYAAAAHRLAEMLKEQPISAKEKLIGNAEFVAKFGPLTHLDPYGRHLTLAQYYLLDVAAFILTVLSVIVVSVVVLLRKCFAGGKKKLD